MPSSTFDIRCDFSDVDRFLRECEAEAEAELREVGRRAVEKAKAEGDYHDVTGMLRASNRYEARDGKLRLINDAPYAADVESRGYDVLAGAAAWAKNEVEKLRQ